ncbi:MAG: NAD+ synthase [Nitrososphaerales archaeon]
MDLLEKMTKLDFKRISKGIEDFIKSKVLEANSSGVVLGLSGGLDSSTAAYLAVRALGKDSVLGLLLPDSRVTPSNDVEDAKAVADELQIKTITIDISNIHRAYMNYLQPHRLAEGNLRARIRMSILYYYANLLNRLVLGTGDRSELLIGYFTKYGDGGVDLLPLAELYKTQVRFLASYLNVPKRIVAKKSSPRLWAGQMAEDELGMSYEDIDQILYSIFDLKMKPEEASNILNIPLDKINSVLSRCRATEHKRLPPPSAKIV